MFVKTAIVLPVLPTKVLNCASYSVTVSCIISCLLYGAPLALHENGLLYIVVCGQNSGVSFYRLVVLFCELQKGSSQFFFGIKHVAVITSLHHLPAT